MTFVFLGLFGLALSLLLVLTLREHSHGSAVGLKIRPPRLLESVRIMFRSRSYFLLVAGTSIAAMAAYPQMLWTPSYFARRFEFSVQEIALVFGTIGLVAGVVGAWFGGYLADRLARKSSSAHMRVPAILQIIAVPALVMIFIAPTRELALVSYFLAMFITAGSGGPVMAATQNLAPPEIRTTSAAICSTLTQLTGTAVSVPLIGVLSDLLTPRFGKDSLGVAMLALPPLAFLAAVLWLASASCAPEHSGEGTGSGR
jgi:MFS family permease